MPSVLSLFSGIGGLDLGLEAYGYETVAYSEVDPYASAVMAARFPEAAPIGDITQASWLRYKCGTCTVSGPQTSDLAAADQDGEVPLGNADQLVIAGGFPCQDISLAGKGAGIDGERSGLWRYYADAIRALRPRGVLVENVSALTSRGLDRVLGDLASCGYDAEWDCIPAAAVGAPHRRDRIFVVATRSDVAPFDIDTFADADEQRAQVSDRRQLAAIEQPGGASCARGSWRAPTGSDWWRVEPGVGRVAHGIPRRVDRLRCLGNAVVPQVAEHVAGVLHERISGAAYA
jgi:DNA (cytosine-5)-methyltransferase 1